MKKQLLPGDVALNLNTNTYLPPFVIVVLSVQPPFEEMWKHEAQLIHYWVPGDNTTHHHHLFPEEWKILIDSPQRPNPP